MRINGTDPRADLLALAADPALVGRLPLDRILALRAAIRALRLLPRGPADRPDGERCVECGAWSPCSRPHDAGRTEAR